MATLSVKKPNRRLCYWTYPRFQGKQATIIAAAVFFSVFMTSAVMYYVLLQQARQRIIDPSGATSLVTFFLVSFALVVSLVSAAGVACWSILTSHRICGPMRVLKNYFSQLSAGRIPEVRSLRRNDEFRDVHEAFGDAMALLRAQKHQEVERITQALVSLERAGRCDAAERERALSSIRVALSGLREQATAAFSSNGQPGLEPKESKTVDHRAADESRSRRSRGTGIQTAVTNAAPI